MHTDARTLPDGSTLEADLCIVGAGAAGISMALEWIDSRHTVLLLEGGGFEFDPAMQDLYRGEIVGEPYYPLHAARLHYFGGTTGHWGGLCSPLDPIDFEEREWVPHSGWPIRREDLDPFYARAHPLLDLGPYEYDADASQRRNPALIPMPLDRRAVWTKMWQLSPPTRFNTRYRQPIVQARNLHLHTYANVCEVEANENVTAVAGLRIRTLDGKEHRVRARQYVLACSTLQNARLLLASNRQSPAGLGNQHDLVGRYFMEHLEIPSGHLVLAPRHAGMTKIYSLDFANSTPFGELALSVEKQRRHRILNGTVSLSPGSPGEIAQSTFEFFTPDVVDAFRRWDEGGRVDPLPFDLPEMPDDGPLPRFFHLATRQEQAPNPDSRVTLSTERDALGMPRVKLDWQLTDLDKQTFKVFYEVLGLELGRSGMGRAQVLDWVLKDDPPWPTTLSGGWHHMGTTRMHDSPRHGVVDASCRVHGLDNLYIAGASVYPTGGAANPTLTLVALSLRLSDHLKTKLA